MNAQEKARQLRYKKPVLARINLNEIRSTLCEIQEVCDDYQYAFDDDETLMNALDGDEDEAYEFKMLFAEVSAKCEKLYELINDDYNIAEYFDDFFVGLACKGGDIYNQVDIYGYDDYEEDYYKLAYYERDMALTTAGKRIMRLSKADMVNIAGVYFGLAMAFLDVNYKYDYLKAAFDVLKDKNTSYLQVVKDIEKAYNEADADEWIDYKPSVRNFNRLINNIDENSKMWVE